MHVRQQFPKQIKNVGGSHVIFNKSFCNFEYMSLELVVRTEINKTQNFREKN